MKSRGELNPKSSKVAPYFYDEEKKSVSDLMSEEIIKRAPDKMMQMTAERFLIFAWLNDVAIVNCDKLGILNEDSQNDCFKHIQL